MSARRGDRGFAISTEILLIGLILVLGTVTGWVKLRDQSLSEIKDSMAAIDAYILGAAPLFQTGGTRWIKADGTIEAPSTTPITEGWGPGDVTWSAAKETSPGSHVYQTDDGVLVYGAAPSTE